MDKSQEAGEKEEAGLVISGRARVRYLLIAPLEAEGIQRGKGVTLAQHDAFLSALQDRLAYLDAETLAVLASVIRRLAQGPLMNLWPSLATITNNAHRLRMPPDGDLPIMSSWFRSIEGPRAEERGYMVELREFLRRAGRPPLALDMTRIREAAAENAARRRRVTEWIEAGKARADEAAWLDWYTGQLAICRALVADGMARRAELAAERAGQDDSEKETAA